MKEKCTQYWWCTIFQIVVYLQLLLSSRPRCHPSSVMISKVDLSLVPSMCFYLRDCIRFNPDNCATWIWGFPQIMIVENTESIESAITFTTHSIDSDNKVLSLEKENCTHGTLCSFHRLASEWLNSYDRHRHYLLVTRFLIALEDVYPICDLISYERLYSSYIGRGLLFELCERTWNHCNE